MRWTSLPNPEKCSTLSSGVPYVFVNFWPVFASGTLVWTWWSGCGLGRWLNQCQLCAKQIGRSQLLKTPEIFKALERAMAQELLKSSESLALLKQLLVLVGLFRCCRHEGHGVYCEEIAWFQNLKTCSILTFI